MAVVKNYSLTRVDVGNILKVPATRGIMFSNQQCEILNVTKLTGDTGGTVVLTDVQRPYRVFALPLNDSAGAAVTTQQIVELTFTKPDQTSIVLSGLGTWTVALIFAAGRSYKTS